MMLSSHVCKHQRGERPPAAAPLVVSQLNHRVGVTAISRQVEHGGAALWADQVTPAARTNRWQGCLGVSHGSGAHHYPVASAAVAHSRELTPLGRPAERAPAQISWGAADRPAEAIGAGHDPVAGAAATHRHQQLPLRRPAKGGPGVVGCRAAATPADAIRGGHHPVALAAAAQRHQQPQLCCPADRCPVVGYGSCPQGPVAAIA
jgi:hypothetical protein